MINNGYPKEMFYNQRARRDLATATDRADVLDVMSRDMDWDVSYAVVHNPHTSDETLKYFVSTYKNSGTFGLDAEQALAERGIKERTVAEDVGGETVDNGEVRMRRGNPITDDSLSAEERDIEEHAKANGTYLKSPNGKPTKLTPRQWVQVRTKAFKDWFGDWELATKAVNIVSAMAEHGFKNFAEARDWAKKNIVRTLSNEETGNKGEIRISNTAIDKFLSKSSVDKSENKDVHLSVLKVLPDVIRESVDVEQHPDYKKGDDGIRRKENGENKDVTIHRLYGSVRIGDNTYRVKITLKEDARNSKLPKGAYSYEATKIELLAGTLGKPDGDAPSTNNSISIAKLLQGVKKSNSEEEILNVSKVVDENGEPLVVYHGTPNKFTIFDASHISETSGDRGLFGAGFYFNPDAGYVKLFAAKYGFNVADVKKYADSMRKGSLGGASYAFSIMRRKILIDNADNSFGEFVKIFAPIKAELYDRFGNIDELREKHVQEEMEARSVMEAARKRAEEEAEAERKRLEEFEVMSDEQLDDEYFKAIEKNDEPRMRDLVNEAARRRGYGEEASGYQGVGAWSAPSNPGFESVDERRAALRDNGTDVNVADIAAGYTSQPGDYFSNLRAYGNDTEHGRESAAAISKAMSEINDGKVAMVKVYRAVPKSIKEGKLRNGDWVTPSRKYAEMHGDHRLEGKYRIIEQEVPADELWWDGNDINEWGYDDGKSYSYKNTKNNRKLNNLITRDDSGNIIPLSKRFNPKKSDVRFLRDGFWNRMTSDEIFEALSGLSDFGNGGATRLILDLEKHFGGTLESASSGARSALENGLVPFAGNQYEGTDNEYHHMAFIDENGERHVESVPFTTQESIKEVRSDVRFAGDIFNIDGKQAEASQSTSQSAKRQVAEGLSKKLGVPVAFEDRTTLKGRSRRFAGAKAWFVLPNARNPKGEIHINVDNHADVEDVECSILHEVVGHMGMRRMMGEAGYNALLDKVYGSMDEGARAYFGEYARQEFDRKDGMTDEQYQAELRRVAADEYIAALAEVGTDPTTWQKVVSLVREALRRIGFSLSLSDADIRALLYESRHNLESAAYYAEKEILRQRQEAFRAAAELSNRLDQDISEYDREYGNIESGIKALQALSDGAEEVSDAMNRTDLSEYGGTTGITFVYGQIGDADKKFKGGYGISHIAAKHGVQTVFKAIDVIANGTIARYVPGNKTVVLEKDGYQAVLALTRFGERNTWLLSGWKKEETADDSGEVSTATTSTQTNPTFSREDLGAAVSGANIDNIFDTNPDIRMRRDLSGTEYDKRLGVVSLTPDGATKRQELHNLATLWGKRLLDSSLPLKNLINYLKHTKGGKVTSDTDLWSLKTTIPSKVMY